MNKGSKMIDRLNDGKVALATAVATVSSGTAGILQILPLYLSIIATFLGSILSTIIIYNKITIGRLERKALKLEIERGEQALIDARNKHKECEKDQDCF